MALKKEIILDNGVIVNYHRIVSMNKITNDSIIIEVNSYISENQREKEKRYQELQKKSANGEELTDEEQEELNKGINILVEADYISIKYDQNINIEDTYKYLKTTEKFKGSEDV